MKAQWLICTGDNFCQVIPIFLSTDNIPLSVFWVASNMHEGLILHKDTFAQVDFYLFKFVANVDF